MGSQVFVDRQINNMKYITNNKGISVVYIIHLIGHPGKYKYGKTDDVTRRMSEHSRMFGEIEIIEIIRLPNASSIVVGQVEKAFEDLTKRLGIWTPMPDLKQKEIITPSTSISIDVVIKAFREYVGSIDTNSAPTGYQPDVQTVDADMLKLKLDHEYRMASMIQPNNQSLHHDDRYGCAASSHRFALLPLPGAIVREDVLSLSVGCWLVVWG